MTKKQIVHIVEDILNDNVDEYTILRNCYAFVIDKDARFVPDISKYRFKFDTTNNIVEKINVRLYSRDATVLPSHSNYDIATNSKTGEVTVYEYISDNEGNVYTDFYDFENVMSFVPNVNVEVE